MFYLVKIFCDIFVLEFDLGYGLFLYSKSYSWVIVEYKRLKKGFFNLFDNEKFSILDFYNDIIKNKILRL